MFWHEEVQYLQVDLELMNKHLAVCEESLHLPFCVLEWNDHRHTFCQSSFITTYFWHRLFTIAILVFVFFAKCFPSDSVIWPCYDLDPHWLMGTMLFHSHFWNTFCIILEGLENQVLLKSAPAGIDLVQATCTVCKTWTAILRLKRFCCSCFP